MISNSITVLEAAFIVAADPCKADAVCVLLNPLPSLLTDESEGDRTVVATC